MNWDDMLKWGLENPTFVTAGVAALCSKLPVVGKYVRAWVTGMAAAPLRPLEASMRDLGRRMDDSYVHMEETRLHVDSTSQVLWYWLENRDSRYLFKVDADGTVLNGTKAFRELVGLDDPSNLRNCFDEQSRTVWDEALSAVVEHQSAIDVRVKLRSGKGWYRLLGKPVARPNLTPRVVCDLLPEVVAN